MSHGTNRFLSLSASQVLINPPQRHERPWTASFNNLQLSEWTLLLKTKRRLHPACFINPNVSANTFNFLSVIHSFPLTVSSHLHFLYSILLSTSSILSLCCLFFNLLYHYILSLCVRCLTNELLSSIWCIFSSKYWVGFKCWTVTLKVTVTLKCRSSSSISSGCILAISHWWLSTGDPELTAGIVLGKVTLGLLLLSWLPLQHNHV